MKFEMVMPKMGESITEGTIVKWLKSVGDEIEKDDIIVEISTDKVDSEIPTPVAGKIVKFLAEENETLEVGAPIAIIETEAKAAEAAEQQAETKTSEVEEKEPDKKDANTDKPKKPEKKDKVKGKRFYSPVVLNIAASKDIDMSELEQIKGSGLNGRVTKKDLLAYIEESEKAAEAAPAETAIETERPTIPAAGDVDIIPMDNMRKSIAEHMIHSKKTSAHVNLYTEVDMQAVHTIRENNKDRFKSRQGFGLSFLPFIVESTVSALKEFPMINASIEGENIKVKKYFNIGIAVALEKGLIVPNIYNADEKNLLGLARNINDIATRARNKKLNPDELQNGTFSISNFGVYGTVIGFPIINQPQVAILGVGAVKKRPVVINDAIAIRPIMYLALTIDHRLIDGAMGSQFLERVRELLESYDPEMKL